jgi:hypothetical protein
MKVEKQLRREPAHTIIISVYMGGSIYRLLAHASQHAACTHEGSWLSVDAVQGPCSFLHRSTLRMLCLSMTMAFG